MNTINTAGASRATRMIHPLHLSAIAAGAVSRYYAWPTSCAEDVCWRVDPVRGGSIRSSERAFPGELPGYRVSFDNSRVVDGALAYTAPAATRRSRREGHPEYEMPQPYHAIIVGARCAGSPTAML